jgi:hypothetical protein
MLEVGVEEGLWQVILGGVLLGEGGVGFDDGYELGVGVPGERGEEAFYVSVDKADYGYSDGFVCWLSVERGCCECGEKEELGKFDCGPQMEVMRASWFPGSIG